MASELRKSKVFYAFTSKFVLLNILDDDNDIIQRIEILHSSNRNKSEVILLSSPPPHPPAVN
jgi:hypothetical protein